MERLNLIIFDYDNEYVEALSSLFNKRYYKYFRITGINDYNQLEDIISAAKKVDILLVNEGLSNRVSSLKFIKNIIYLCENKTNQDVDAGRVYKYQSCSSIYNSIKRIYKSINKNVDFEEDDDEAYLITVSSPIGGVVLGDDDELLKNLIKMLKKEIIKRKKLFSEVGASSLLNYKLASSRELPHIILMIDNFIAFKESYEEYEDDLIFFAREGVALGITVIATGTQLNGVSYRMQGNFKMKTLFTCLYQGEYSNVFNVGVMKPSNKKGRAITECVGVNEVQIALPGASVSEVDRIAELTKTIEEINTKWKGDWAKAIPTVPDTVLLNDVFKDIDQDESCEKLLIPCGYNEDELENIAISLDKYPIFSIIGDNKTGKSNMLKNVIYSINHLSKEAEVIIFDSSNGGLRTLKGYENIKYYVNDKEEYEEVLDFIEREGERRKEEVE